MKKADDKDDDVHVTDQEGQEIEEGNDDKDGGKSVDSAAVDDGECADR